MVFQLAMSGRKMKKINIIIIQLIMYLETIFKKIIKIIIIF